MLEKLIGDDVENYVGAGDDVELLIVVLVVLLWMYCPALKRG